MKNIYLIGMPGCGKSTLGPLLAKKLGYQWMDTDQEIYTRWGKTPEDIIKYQGEEAFRLLEKHLMETLLDTTALVVSTGGGLPMFHDWMNMMNQRGITVYIEASVEELWRRIKGQGGRPLAQTMEDIKRLMEERKSVYEKAQIILSLEEDGKDWLGQFIEQLQKL